jgi:hypothetical protein
MQFIQFMQWEKDEVPEPIQELMKQRDELRHKRKELIKQLKELVAELEGQPQRPDIGFPFNLLVRFVYRALGTIEALASRVGHAFVK